MIKLLAIAVSVLSISSVSHAATYPFQPITLEKYTDESKNGRDFTRLRLAVSIDDDKPDQNLRIGDLIFCSVSACYRPQAANYVSAKSTADGAATVVFDTLVPYDNITSVYFGDVAGQKNIAGKVDLPSPLALTKDFQGGDILVLLKKNVGAKNISYAPVQAVSAYLDREAQAIYYNPNFETSAHLKFGAVLNLPAGALEKPQIFSVAVRDVGKATPWIDIFPALQTKKSFTVDVVQIDNSVTARSLNGSGRAPIPSGPPPTSKLLKSDGDMVLPAKKSFSRTGLLKFSTGGDNGKSISAIAAAEDTTQCAEMLSNPTNQYYISNLLAQNGGVQITWCENIPPYAHIMVFNRLDSRIKFSIPYTLISGNDYRLKPITEYTADAMVAINGFYWYGDKGIIPYGVGQVAGYLTSDRRILGLNWKNGVPNPAAYTDAGNKVVYRTNKSGSNPLWNEQSNIEAQNQRDNAVSSSTSVVRFGSCTTDSLVSRWSAIGETNGKMMMISSTSDGTTSAAALCPLFQAWGITEALRLDGGPSAGITAGKVHLNPLSGAERLVYGSIRSTAYALKIGY